MIAMAIEEAKVMAEQAKAELYSRITLQFVLGLAVILTFSAYAYYNIQFVILSELAGTELIDAWGVMWSDVTQVILGILVGIGITSVDGGSK